MRKEPSQTLIYGIHAVSALLQRAPQRVIKILQSQQRNDQRLQTLLQSAHEFTIEKLSPQQLDQICETDHHQGIVALCLSSQTYSEAHLDDLFAQPDKNSLILILDKISDPHNLGACLRSAAAADVNLVIAPKDGAVGLNATVRKVACGAAEIVPFMQVTNLVRTMKALQQKGAWIFGADARAQQSIYSTDLTGHVVLALGAEGKGLRRLTAENCDALVTIPMPGAMNSLNVSVATGVCLFEVVRQRHLKI